MRQSISRELQRSSLFTDCTSRGFDGGPQKPDTDWPKWFIATQVVGDNEAIAAAKEIGATAVVWSKNYLNSTTNLTTRVQPVTSNTTTTIVGDVNAQVTTTQTDYQYIPETRTNHWWKYEAAFYRMPN